MRIFGLATILGCFVHVTSAYAQDCNALLEHGLRNIRRSKSTEAAVATKYYNHCFKDFKSLSDSQLASVEVEVFGYGGGGGSYSRSQREERLTTWCKQSNETAQLNRSQYEESQSIYSEAVAAWQNCNKLKSADVQIEPTISADAKTVDISMKYTGGAARGVQFLGVDAEGFECRTRVPSPEGVRGFDADSKTPTYVDREAIKVRCLRSRSEQRTRTGTTFDVVPRGTIAVNTAGADLQLFFPEEWDPGVPSREADQLRASIAAAQLPRGTILAWYTKTGPAPPGWAVCDGKNGTPNLQGQFLVGTTVFGDVGQSGGDSKHLHAVAVALPDSGRKGSDWRWGDTPWAGGPNPVMAGSVAAAADERNHLPPWVSVVYIMKL